MRYWLLVLPTVFLSACQSAPISSSSLEVAKPITLSAKQVSSVRSGVARVLKNNDLEDARVDALGVVSGERLLRPDVRLDPHELERDGHLGEVLQERDRAERAERPLRFRLATAGAR